ncbi:MAG TPA: hypothetical protein VNJ51_02740 [Candidatus Dormibacteraeota bacterium]|nr:hypothetical protein [Candidatus Dormibacteraeota bacterium]
MMNRLRGLAAAVALALAALAPLAAHGAEGALTQTYAVAYNDWAYGGSAGDYEGTLQLTYYPGGAISGWYRPNYGGSFEPVVGGKNDGRVWLSIGHRGTFRVQVRLEGDRLVGTATQAMKWYDFSATPSNG